MTGLNPIQFYLDGLIVYYVSVFRFHTPRSRYYVYLKYQF